MRKPLRINSDYWARGTLHTHTRAAQNKHRQGSVTNAPLWARDTVPGKRLCTKRAFAHSHLHTPAVVHQVTCTSKLPHYNTNTSSTALKGHTTLPAARWDRRRQRQRTLVCRCGTAIAVAPQPPTAAQGRRGRLRVQASRPARYRCRNISEPLARMYTTAWVTGIAAAPFTRGRKHYTMYNDGCLTPVDGLETAVERAVVVLRAAKDTMACHTSRQ